MRVAEELTARGCRCLLDVRPGLGHVHPPAFSQELPELLDALTR